jgi:LmbE family N-acetylglucosaminyl deacetylase
MINKFKNVLVLAPHTDDGELGLGGTIVKLLNQGSEVTYVAFSTAEKSVPKGFPTDILKTEVKEATKILGIKPENLIVFNYEVRKLNFYRQDILEELIQIRNRGRFDLVFIPSSNDIHQDHSTISQEGIRAFKGISIFGYELIWNNLQFSTDCFSILEDKHLEIKIDALSAYSSQGSRDYLSPEFIRSWSKMRGVQIGEKYAEAFEVIRLVI